jgi:two-component system, chemotaxis family, chemotaxis protein CheY
MKILVAEDETSISAVYRLALEDRGHQIIITNDGQECVNAYEDELKKLPDKSDAYLAVHPPFDAVILDYRMPRMDGMDAAKLILSKNSHQRIIFASAYVLSTLQESVKNLHAIVELLQKPFELSVLVDTVEDKEIFEALKKINVDIQAVQNWNPNHEQLRDLLQALKKLHKTTPLVNC